MMLRKKSDHTITDLELIEFKNKYEKSDIDFRDMVIIELNARIKILTNELSSETRVTDILKELVEGSMGR